MTLTYNRRAIMRFAWQLLREHRARVARSGYFGKPVTIGDCIRRAWDSAKYEAWSVKTGRTSNIDLCEFVTAPVAIELREAA